ncbi:MAG: GIY-YIG nuclease family protein [Rubrivivax sp.]|nr:GIY-YIG nuclease family protein [Pyrinomonadaceae bacterium]
MRSELENTLEKIIAESPLVALFQHRGTDYVDAKICHARWSVSSNPYRIRKFELWNRPEGLTFRVYYAPEMPAEVRNSLLELGSRGNFTKNTMDLRGRDLSVIASDVASVLADPNLLEVAKLNYVPARTSKFEGLDLPDVDIASKDILCRPFTWRQIIKVWEDSSEDNELKAVLQCNGVYLQRSADGNSRYVGSAYGGGGIIGRWMKHLTSNGDAQHLNLFVLENGYNAVEFVVLEVCDSEAAAREAEAKWKIALATNTSGVYDGCRLNRN